MEQTLPSDLTDAEWALVAPYVAPARIARPRQHDARDVLNAILYVLHSGCSWRMLPRSFPPWKTVYHHFARWSRLGVFAAISDVLLPQVRKKGGAPSSRVLSLSMLGRANLRAVVRFLALTQTSVFTVESTN